MRIESKLCHLSENKAVVQVNGWINEKNVGSALAEGSTVEIAEDNAISRLNKRLNRNSNNNETNINLNDEHKINTQVKVQLPKSEKLETLNSNQEPTDWSQELTSIDAEIKRLNWSREDEIDFLQKNFNYNNRNKITKYTELVNYLNILKKININDSSESNIQNINTMIEESDIILRELSWDNNQGREYLLKEYNVTTRRELDEEQLRSFLAKLRSIRNQYLSN